MNTVEEDLRTFLLNDPTVFELVGERIHENTVPGQVDRPYIWFIRQNETTPRMVTGEADLTTVTYSVEAISYDIGLTLEIARNVARVCDGYRGVMGGLTVGAMFVDDKSDDYIPRGNGSDDGLHVTAIEIVIIYQGCEVAKFVGFGSKLSYDATAGGAGTTWIDLAYVRSIKRDDANSNVSDVTTLDNATRFETKLGGTVNPGSVTLELVFDPDGATHKTMALLLSDQRIANFKITYSDATTTTEIFNGFVQSIGCEIPLREAVTRSVKIEVTGAPGFETA